MWPTRNANLREMSSSAEAAPPPHGTARSALFLPGQLELDPKQQQMVVEQKRAHWVLSQPRGLRSSSGVSLLLWETEVGSGQRWSAQAGSARSWNCISFCHLAEFRPFTPCAVVSGKESATILVHPAAESSSPNPSSDCAPAEFSLPHFSFFSSGSSALSFPPRCGGCFKVFFAV